jgi:hypothetical protein
MSWVVVICIVTMKILGDLAAVVSDSVQCRPFCLSRFFVNGVADQ